jgi:hypothetical protein
LAGLVDTFVRVARDGRGLQVVGAEGEWLNPSRFGEVTEFLGLAEGDQIEMTLSSASGRPGVPMSRTPSWPTLAPSTPALRTGTVRPGITEPRMRGRDREITTGPQRCAGHGRSEDWNDAADDAGLSLVERAPGCLSAATTGQAALLLLAERQVGRSLVWRRSRLLFETVRNRRWYTGAPA